MSAKTMSSLTDDNRDLRKQIGCMNGIFQLFDRHHFLTGRRISSHNQKRLLQGSQHQLDPQYGTKGFTEKSTDMHKEKPRISTESSRLSYSSSSCSSTFSSLDFNRLVSQTETLPPKQINIPKTPFQITTAKEQQQPFRDVVKDSMHREARSLPIKSMSKDDQRGVVMKHIDSPRPSPQPKPTRVLTKDDRLALPKDDRLALPRFSYDGRESREAFKSAMKHKELPRFSLDSKTSSMKCSDLESRLTFPVNQESAGSINRTSSVVAKLMGLDVFPSTISTEESTTPSTKSCPKEADQSKQNQFTYSPRVSPNNATSARSRFPMEPAPWSQQDSPKKSTHQSPSVYGQIEKRITELEFKRSGKDLRALKQILESMQKTRTQLQNQIKEPTEFTSQRRTRLDVSSSAVIVKPAKVMDKVKLPVQRLQTRSPKYQSANSADRQKAKDLTPKRSSRKEPNFQHLPSAEKNPIVSPRLQQKLVRIQEQSRPTTPLSDSGRIKKHCNKKLTEKGHQNSKHKVKVKDLQLSDDQLSELSSETRYSVKSESNNSLVSHSETEVTSLPRSINTNAGRKENSVSTTREHMPAVKIAVTVLEQPSPISVLDDTFYSEDSPSPVKKISSAFREDESPNPDEAEWHLSNLNHLTNSTRSNHGNKHKLKFENTKNFDHELTLSDNEPDETSANLNALLPQVSLNPNHRYINKILLTSGLLKDTSFISTSDKLISSNHLINPDMFHILKQTEETIEKNDKNKLNEKNQRKIVFDMVDEILVRKITSGRLFTMVKKRTSPQGLLKEVYSEIDRLCIKPDCNLDNEEDEMIKQLNADMKYESEDWVDYSGEFPALVLDIERLIFKDMINEIVSGEVMGNHDLPKRHCRKLFSK